MMSDIHSAPPFCLPDIPEELRLLIRTVQDEAIEYPDRVSDWIRAVNCLGEKNYVMARYILEQMQTFQKNLREGVPAELQLLIRTVQGGFIEYPGCATDWMRAMDCLEGGNYSKARREFEKIRFFQLSLLNLK